MATASAIITYGKNGSKTFKATVTYSVTNTNTATTINITKLEYSGAPKDGAFVPAASCSIDKESSRSADLVETGASTIPSLVEAGASTIPSSRSKTLNISKSITRTKSASTHHVYVVAIYIRGSKRVTKETAVTITIPAKPSYAVTYNANGGSGAPAKQTKWYNETLALSTDKPIRDGYNFLRWNTNSGGTGTNYNSGANYTGNAALTLYAQWQIKTYTISYNANGGGTAPASQTKNHGASINLQSAIVDRPNYRFAGWNTKPDGTGTSYGANASYTGNASITLYAQWTRIYQSPELSITRSFRSDAYGNSQDTGSYVTVDVSYKLFDTAAVDNGANGVDTLICTVNNVTATPTTASDSDSMEGTARFTFNASILDDESYSVTVVLEDSNTYSGGDSHSRTATDLISVAYFPVDICVPGHGIAFGAAAKGDGFVVDMEPFLIKALGGTIMLFAGQPSQVPSGWLPCDGSPVSRSTYSRLYTKIGTTYGSGDGETTFNLPNLVASNSNMLYIINTGRTR